MRLVQYLENSEVHLGLFHNGTVVGVHQLQAAERLPSTLPSRTEHLLWHLDDFEATFRRLDTNLKRGDYRELGTDFAQLHVLPPVEKPNSTRDGYAFRQHVQTARRNRGVDMIAEFDQFPVFYFTNHNSIVGPGPVPLMRDHFVRLDYELEAAVVLGRQGRNLRAQHADDYIFGYTILNDFSARTLQMEEMLLSLGPAKGKDFANALGPMLVTPDELEHKRIAPPAGHVGAVYDLRMEAWVNGERWSEGSLGSMDWTFAEIIERASYGADVFPTDVIGSGTVGTGCLLELNGTRKLENPAYEPVWLKEGDEVTLFIDELGTLTNLMTLEDGEWSLLAQKKLA
jgi:fumarylacetoacetate (FAA) hydrolase